jgi:hypothetical protein
MPKVAWLGLLYWPCFSTKKICLLECDSDAKWVIRESSESGLLTISGYSTISEGSSKPIHCISFSPVSINFNFGTQAHN